MRVDEGDRFHESLNDTSSAMFLRKSEAYRRQIDAVYKRSPLADAYRRSAVERLAADDDVGDGDRLVVHFRLFLDRRKIPSSAFFSHQFHFIRFHLDGFGSHPYIYSV